MKRLMLVLALLFVPSLACAQALMPYDQSTTVGTTAVQVLSTNPQRKQVSFHNPSGTATVAVCPAIKRGGAALTCTVNGAGSRTLLPGDWVTISGIGGNPQLAVGWNAIASAPSSPLTVWEFE